MSERLSSGKNAASRRQARQFRNGLKEMKNEGRKYASDSELNITPAAIRHKGTRRSREITTLVAGGVTAGVAAIALYGQASSTVDAAGTVAPFKAKMEGEAVAGTSVHVPEGERPTRQQMLQIEGEVRNNIQEELDRERAVAALGHTSLLGQVQNVAEQSQANLMDAAQKQEMLDRLQEPHGTW